MIEAIELTTRRRRRRALEAVSFQVRPGQVTGLLGLPGSGKTAVLRRMLQLERGGGRTLYDGRPFRSLAYPMRSVGVLLDPLAVHPGRTVVGHLRLALSADPEAAPGGLRERIEAVLDVVGLTDQARARIFELTEGMTVRLGIAQALLGDPQALLLDEPECGLEAEGRPWLSALLRAYAAQGRCVLVTGQSTDALLGYADRILVMDTGRLVGQRTTRQAARELAGDCVIVRTPQALRLAAILVAAGAEPTQLDGACLEVRGLDRARIGDLAFRNEVPLHELAVRTPGEDPVVAVLEACRKPPTVVPVQTPPAVRVPDAAPATVRMPFEGALDQEEPGWTQSHKTALRDLTGMRGAGVTQGQAPLEAAVETLAQTPVGASAASQVVSEVLSEALSEGEVLRPGDASDAESHAEELAAGLSYCPSPFGVESAVLSVSAAPGSGPVEGDLASWREAETYAHQTSTSALASNPSSALTSTMCGASGSVPAAAGSSRNASNVKVIESEVVTVSADEASAGGGSAGGGSSISGVVLSGSTSTTALSPAPVPTPVTATDSASTPAPESAP